MTMSTAPGANSDALISVTYEHTWLHAGGPPWLMYLFLIPQTLCNGCWLSLLHSKSTNAYSCFYDPLAPRGHETHPSLSFPATTPSWKDRSSSPDEETTLRKQSSSVRKRFELHHREKPHRPSQEGRRKVGHLHLPSICSTPTLSPYIK